MFEKQVKIPSPEEMKEKNALSPSLTALKRERDELVKDVLAGRQNKFLLIVGPCSARYVRGDQQPVFIFYGQERTVRRHRFTGQYIQACSFDLTFIQSLSQISLPDNGPPSQIQENS